MSGSRKICAHLHCDCPVAGDEAYCSSYCASVERHREPEVPCSCGHEPCTEPPQTHPHSESKQTRSSIGRRSG